MNNRANKKKQLLLWDLDGTLLDTLDDLTLAVNAALKKYNLPLRTKEEVQTFVGNGIEKLVERAVPLGKENPKFLDTFLYFKNYYGRHCSDNTKPFPGIVDLLAKLKNDGWKMGIISNKIHSAVLDLNDEFFGEYIDLALGDNVYRKKKPNPANVIFALQRFECSKEEAIFIGDSAVDIMTAQNTPMDLIVVDWGNCNREKLISEGAEVVVSDINELYEILKGKE